jgi:hypothetical protein
VRPPSRGDADGDASEVNAWADAAAAPFARRAGCWRGDISAVAPHLRSLRLLRRVEPPNVRRAKGFVIIARADVIVQ